MKATDDIRAQNTLAFLRYWKTKSAAESESRTPTYENYKSIIPGLRTARFSCTPVASGQIRLLPQTQALLDVLLYRPNREQGTWTVIPLSDIPFPASEMEVTFGDRSDSSGIRTYRLWNLFDYPENTLINHSWVIGQISQDELNSLQTLLHGLYLGKDIPEGLLQNCGTVIEYDFDDRLRYEQQCAEIHQEAIQSGNRISIALKLKEFCDLSDATEHWYAAATPLNETPLVYYTPPEFPGEAHFRHHSTCPFAMPLDSSDNTINAGCTLPLLIWHYTTDALQHVVSVRLAERVSGQILGTCKIDPQECEIIFDEDVIAPTNLNLTSDLVLLIL